MPVQLIMIYSWICTQWIVDWQGILTFALHCFRITKSRGLLPGVPGRLVLTSFTNGQSRLMNTRALSVSLSPNVAKHHMNHHMKHMPTYVTIEAVQLLSCKAISLWYNETSTSMNPAKWLLVVSLLNTWVAEPVSCLWYTKSYTVMALQEHLRGSNEQRVTRVMASSCNHIHAHWSNTRTEQFHMTIRTYGYL